MTSAGLELAKLADLPDDIMFEARRVANNLARIEAEKQASSKTSQVVARRKALLTVHPSISSIVVVQGGLTLWSCISCLRLASHSAHSSI